MAEPAPKRARVDEPCLCSYAAVSAHFHALLPGESQAVDAAPVAVRAQVVHKRQLSAKLVFIDPAEGTAGSVFELVNKGDALRPTLQITDGEATLIELTDTGTAGDLMVTTLVAKSEKELDLDVYNRPGKA